MSSLDDEFMITVPDSDSNSVSDTKTSQMPNGIGLSLDEIKALIAKNHKTVVADDDPILITVTILNAFIEEVQKLNAKYNKALKEIYAEQSLEFQKKIEQTSVTIRKSLQDISLDGLTRLHGRHTIAIEKLRLYMFFCTGIIGLSAFIHVALYILK